MFDKEKFTPEFYNKLSNSEKKELVQVMLEDQLTDPLHINGLPKLVQNFIKKAVRNSAKEMKEETIMNTGENKLSAEMMKKIYEAFRLDTQEKIDEFNEAARKIISDKDYFGGDDDILKHVEGTLITDNHERRIHDPSGKQVLNMFFDNPYPVIMPEDEKMMREMSDEIKSMFHDAILYGDSFVQVYRAPRWVERYLEKQRWIDGIRDPEIDILTGCTQHFKPQQKIDMLEAVLDVLDTDKPDRNGRVWQKELLMKQLMKPMWMIPPRHHKSWMWMKLLQMQSYEIQHRTLMNPTSTKWDINSVIHMRWPKPELYDLKAHNFRYGKMWDDQALINYATGDVSHIDMMILDSLTTFGPDINSGYGLSTPNLNDIDKKKLERVIKKGRKRK